MKVSSIQNDDIMDMPIPKRFLPVVIHALSKAMEAEEAALAPQAVPTNAVAATEGSQTSKIDWANIENMRKLRKGLNLRIAIELMDLVSAVTEANPDQTVTVSFEEIYKKAQFTELQRARSSIGAFTKIIKRDFHVTYEDAKWPVECQPGPNGEIHYSMQPEVAKAWIQSAA